MATKVPSVNVKIRPKPVYGYGTATALVVCKNVSHSSRKALTGQLRKRGLVVDVISNDTTHFVLIPALGVDDDGFVGTALELIQEACGSFDRRLVVCDKTPS